MRRTWSRHGTERGPRAGRLGGRPHRERGLGLQRGRGLRRPRRPGPALRTGPFRPPGPGVAPDHRTSAHGGCRHRVLGRRGRDPRPLLRDAAARRAARPPPFLVDQLAPFFLGLAVGGSGHYRARHARLRADRPRRHRRLRGHGDVAADLAPRVHPARRLGRLASFSARWCRRGPASWRSSATSGSRCPTARSAWAAGTGWWRTPPSPSSRCGWPGRPAWSPTGSRPDRTGGAGRRARSSSSVPSSPPRRASLPPSSRWCSWSRSPGCSGVSWWARAGRHGACSSWRCRPWWWPWPWPCPGSSVRRWRGRDPWPSSAFRSPGRRRRAGVTSFASPSGRWPVRPSPGCWWRERRCPWSSPAAPGWPGPRACG